jgi:serine/threonine protein kinase
MSQSPPPPPQNNIYGGGFFNFVPRDFAQHLRDRAISKLGSGASGEAWHYVLTYLSTSNVTYSMNVAIKIPHDDDEDLRKEALFLSRVDSPYVIKLLFAGESNGSYKLTTELFGRRVTLQSRSSASDAVKRQILSHILIGLESLHKKNIIHGDFGPHNVLINENNEVKIIDLGFSEDVRAAATEVTNILGDSELLTAKTDMMGVGKIIELLYPGTTNTLVQTTMNGCLNRIPANRATLGVVYSNVFGPQWPK